MKRPGETDQECALRRTFLLVESDIPAKHIIALNEYIDGLSKEELSLYVEMAQRFYDRRTLGAKRIKVSLNAVKLCIKLSKCGYNTFPYVEKIATKGWDIAGGTYGFSIPLLVCDTANRELFSSIPITDLVKDNVSLDVEYSATKREFEINYK
jgi:hypothetical protein